MKMNSMLMAMCLTAFIVLAAGCTSSSNSSAGTPPSPTINSVSSVNPSSQGSLTETQKTTALNIAKGNATVKEILSKSGYSVTDVLSSGDNTAVVYIDGGSTVHSDGSIWTPDMYQVSVDLSGNKVAGIKHIEPKALPTPTAKS
jgi:ABC-type oligopeptide transport system substrate-binding subunit